MKTVCLNMIVKNEEKIITRMLDSVITFIDTFCIVDTGSTDNTVQVIMDYFKGKNIGGKLGNIPFQNFEKTRNWAMEMSFGMSDYTLFMDADMVLVHNISKKNLTKDYYAFFQQTGDVRFHNTRLVKNNGNFYYRGVTHEVILSREKVDGEILPDHLVKIIDKGDGGCKYNKLTRDKKLLEDHLEDREMSSRYHFYLANTLLALGNIDKSIELYEKRLKMGGWKQELWCTCYKLGCIFYIVKDFHKSMFYFLEAYNYDKNRVENLYYLVKFYKDIKKVSISNIYLNIALDIIKNKDFRTGDLFLEAKFYNPNLFTSFS
jgi:glycosyltransferase involved in cell wall biosynthesis